MANCRIRNFRLSPGHEIVGVVAELGEGVKRFAVGDRVGVPWVGYTCGKCPFCISGRENLCDFARFTGYTLDGGYAECMVADERFCFPIPAGFSDAEAAPLLCAGLIGYRSLVMTGEARRLGIYGFGAAAHIIAQVARHQGRQVFAFTRSGDEAGQQFARSSARFGRESRLNGRLKSWTRRLSSRRSGPWCRRRSDRWRKEASWSAPEST